MLASELIKTYEEFCPQELSMEGDVVGLQIGSLDKEIQKVMVTLDVRENTVAEAIEKGVDLIIAKHAPIFRPVKDLVSSPDRDILLDLVKHDIAVYVSHTNIDVVNDGLNDWFCDLLDIKDTTYLTQTSENHGIGRVGDIAPQTIEELALKVKAVFGLDSVRLVRYDHDNPLVSRVAICGGSGQGFYKDALKKGAQVFITGDVYYHTGQEMITNGLLAIDPGHHIEALFISKIAEKLKAWKREHDWNVTILESQSSTNPFDHLQEDVSLTWLLHQNVVFLALLAGLFTWGCTIVGSAIVFFFKNISRKLLDIMMGFAAGVMIAASFWSLLDPSLTYATQNGYGKQSWFPAAAGFLLGGIALRLIDAVVPHLHLENDISKAEGIQPRKKKLSKTALLFLAITIHNFPEGLAVGVTFGALAGGNMTLAGLMGAIGLAIGIGLQNVPEGAALSIPIRADGKSRIKAFYWGSMSAIVEPIGAVMGAALVLWMMVIIPYALAFAAGAMIFVVTEELIPESQTNGNTDVATLGLMVGFVVMMVMDVALG